MWCLKVNAEVHIQILANIKRYMRNRRIQPRTFYDPKRLAEIVAPLITGHTMPLIGGQGKIDVERLNVMVGTNKKFADECGIEDRKTCLLKIKEQVAESESGGYSSMQQWLGCVPIREKSDRP